MLAILAVLGGVLAAGLWGIEFFPLGASLGGLFGGLLAQRSRIEKLEETIERLDGVASRPRPEPAPTERKQAPEQRPSPPEPTASRPEREAPPPQPPPPPRVSTPEPTPRPEGPDPLERLWLWARPFLTGSSLIVTVGIVVLFFGCAFLLKYAVERGLVPIELRLTAAALGGLALVVVGWRTRVDRPGFGLTLQGGGVGILYLTVFAAFRLYELVPGAMAFVLLFLFVVLSALLAVAQDSLPLATLATAGGFLAPVLTSTGEGSHVALFSYYVLLNGGILAIAWFKSFRLLNLMGFLFTFVISASWGARYYRPDYFATTEPFLILFFLLYVAIAVVFAMRQAPKLRGLVDGTLVFGVPLATAVFQAALVRDDEYGLAWSALAFGAFYVGLASALLRFRPGAARALAEAFLGTGIVFSTLAIPFAFDNLVTSAFWALEGAAMVWVGVRQDRRLPRLSGSALQVVAAIIFLADPGARGAYAVVNGRFFGAILIALAGLATALHLHRDRNRARLGEIERGLGAVFFVWGVAWWLGAGLYEIGSRAENVPDAVGWILLFFTATASLALYLGRRFPWRALERLSLGLLPSLALPLLLGSALAHPLEGLALAGWVVALGTHLAILAISPDTRLLRFWHAAGFWLVALLARWEGSYVVERAVGPGTWDDLAWAAVPIGLVLGLLYLGGRIRWPLREHMETYASLGVAPLAVVLYLWTLLSSFLGAWDPAPLPYVPVLSPIDLVVLLALATLLIWTSSVRDRLAAAGVSVEAARWLAAGSAFVWMHGVVARTAFFYAGVAFDVEALFESTLVQTAVAVLWSLVGLSSMVLGTRRGRRPLWSTGATLMGAVVLKLFLVDLSHTGTVERIVSFIGVGLLLLVVGYVSPVPPREAQAGGATS